MTAGVDSELQVEAPVRGYAKGCTGVHLGGEVGAFVLGVGPTSAAGGPSVGGHAAVVGRAFGAVPAVGESPVVAHAAVVGRAFGAVPAGGESPVVAHAAVVSRAFGAVPAGGESPVVAHAAVVSRAFGAVPAGGERAVASERPVAGDRPAVAGVGVGAVVRGGAAAGGEGGLVRVDALVVGVDAGGTATRAVVADLAGVVVGRGAGGPGNPVAAGRDASLALAAALRQALTGADPRRVVGGVVSLAGASRLADPAVAGAFADVWAASGLDCPMWTCGDAVAAFAAGTPEPAGSVLISGTGAVAARIEAWTIVQVADGLGWLLGDEGSGFWIGLRAVRTVARSFVPGRGLVDLVARHAGVTDADQLVAWATDLPRAAVAGLAPLVCTAAEDGDPDATAIVTEAAARLVGTLDALDSSPGRPVVLAGGVLGHDNPVRDGVLRVLRQRSTTVGTATDPASGAAWLVARDLPGVAPARLHPTLCGPALPES